MVRQTPRIDSARRPMPILMVALIALGVFGLIGLLLVLAVSLEHKKIGGHEPHDKAA